MLITKPQQNNAQETRFYITLDIAYFMCSTTHLIHNGSRSTLFGNCKSSHWRYRYMTLSFDMGSWSIRQFLFGRDKINKDNENFTQHLRAQYPRWPLLLAKQCQQQNVGYRASLRSFSKYESHLNLNHCDVISQSFPLCLGADFRAHVQPLTILNTTRQHATRIWGPFY